MAPKITRGDHVAPIPEGTGRGESFIHIRDDGRARFLRHQWQNVCVGVAHDYLFPSAEKVNVGVYIYARQFHCANDPEPKMHMIEFDFDEAEEFAKCILGLVKRGRAEAR